MRIKFWPWWVSLLAVSLAATVTESQTSRGSVMGIVTRPDDRPLSGVGISLVNVTDRRKTLRGGTNELGRFRIENVPDGTYEIVAAGEGLVRVPHLAPPVLVTISKGSLSGAGAVLTAAARITMASPYSFSGRVSDEAGRPVSSIDVSLMRETYSPSGVRWLTAIAGAKVTTNANGEYRFANIAPDEYYLVATPGRGSSLFINSFYPGVGSPENATAIKALPSAREDHFDFSLLRGARYSIRVTAPPPAIVSPGVLPSFSLIPAGRGRLLTSFTTETMFENAGANVYVSPLVPPDAYTLDVVWGTQNRAQVALEVVDRDIDLGAVIPKDPLTITGRFRGSDIGPNSFSLDNLEPETRTIPAGYAPGDGFKFDWVPEGRYVIAPTPALIRGKRYIESARLGGHEVLEDVFELNAGSSKTLEIVISEAAGSVEGVLQDSKRGGVSYGVSYGRVVLVPAPERRGNPHMFFTAMCDVLGNFTLNSVPPGEYEAFGWDYVEEFAYLNPSFLRKFDGRSTRVRVEPRKTIRPLVDVIQLSDRTGVR